MASGSLVREPLSRRIRSLLMAAAAPLVSVLVTARDNERHVGAALRSVLQQTLGSLELLVADDGSRDSTAAVVESLRDERLTLTRFEQSAGISTRRNELVAQARGRYIAPLDADDVWFHDRLERQVRALEARPDLVAVGSDVLVVDGDVGVGPYFRLPRSDAAVGWTCLFTSPLIHSAATIRATAFEAGVRYDPAFPLAQDYDLWVKLLQHGRAENLAAPLSLYRVHSAQATQRRAPERLAEQETIGRRAIEAGPARLGAEECRLAWCLGAGAPVSADELERAIAAYRRLFSDFAREPRDPAGLREARRSAATTLLRRAGGAADAPAWSLRRAALAIDPVAPVAGAAVKLSNLMEARRHRSSAELLLLGLAGG